MIKRVGLSVVIGLAAIGQVANAADVKVTWTAPTKNTDGTTIPATGTGALTAYLIEWGNCTTAAGVVPQVLGTVAGSLNVVAPATTATVSGLNNSTVYCFRMYALAGTAKSAASATVRAWIPAAGVPNAPGTVTVTAVGVGP